MTLNRFKVFAKCTGIDFDTVRSVNIILLIQVSCQDISSRRLFQLYTAGAACSGDGRDGPACPCDLLIPKSSTTKVNIMGRLICLYSLNVDDS